MKMMRRHASLFSSKDVEVGCYRGTWINYLSPPSIISKKYEPVNQFRYIDEQKVVEQALVAEFSVRPSGLVIIINDFFHSVPPRHPMQAPPLSSSTLLVHDAIDAMKADVDIVPPI